MNLAFEQVRTRAGRTALTLNLSGDVGLADAGTVRKCLSGALREGYRFVVVNLNRVRSVDRSIWECLVSASRRLKRTGNSLVLIGCPDSEFGMLQSLRWDRCFLFPRRRPEDADQVPHDLSSALQLETPVSKPDARGRARIPFEPVTLTADDFSTRHQLLQRIGREHGARARLVFQEFLANALGFGDKRIDLTIEPGRLIAFCRRTSSAWTPSKVGPIFNAHVRLIKALGGRLEHGPDGIRLTCPLDDGPEIADGTGEPGPQATERRSRK